jgi:hypothetical protein
MTQRYFVSYDAPAVSAKLQQGDCGCHTSSDLHYAYGFRFYVWLMYLFMRLAFDYAFGVCLCVWCLAFRARLGRKTPARGSLLFAHDPSKGENCISRKTLQR